MKKRKYIEKKPVGAVHEVGDESKIRRSYKDGYRWEGLKVAANGIDYIDGITEEEWLKLDQITQEQITKLIGLKSQPEIDQAIAEATANATSSLIPITNTVLPRGSNIPDYITSKGKATLRGNDTAETVYTNTGTTPSTITVAIGCVRDAFYDKTTDTWTAGLEQRLPTTPVAGKVVKGGTEAVNGDATYNFVEGTLFEEVPVGDPVLLPADTVRLGKQYNVLNPPTLADSTTADNYIYPIKDIMEIHTTVDDTSGKRQLVYLDANKNTFVNGTVTNFFTGSNVKKFYKKDAPAIAKYISFANLKTNPSVSVLYQDTTYSSEMKYSMVPNIYFPKLFKKFDLTNQIPFGAGTFNKGKTRDSLGELIDDTSYNNYRISLLAIADTEIEVRLNTAYPFINLYNASGVFIESVVIGTGVNTLSKVKYPSATYVDFSLSTASGSLSYFKVRYTKNINDKKPIYNLLDYLTLDETNNSITASFQAIVDTIAATGFGGTIYVPAGIYYLRNPITWRSNINLVGDGSNLTIFKPTGALSAFIGTELSNFTYRDFQIDGELQQLPVAGYNSAIKGIVQTKLIDVTYRDLIIQNTGASGLGTDFFQRGVIHNVRAYNCGRLANLNASAQGASGIGIGTGAFARGMESLVISDCHTVGNMQNGIFVERQATFFPVVDQPVGTVIVNCTAERNRIGFGISGNESATFIGCTGFENHHADFAYDIGTMAIQSSRGKRVKLIGCISKRAGQAIPDGYPERDGDKNGYGLFIKQDYDGIELTNCNFTSALRSGIFVKGGMTAIFINGGTISENGECGIELNGIINKGKISPSLVDKNTIDGLKINGNTQNVIIKDGIYTDNLGYGINKTAGSLVNSIVKDNLVYNNTLGNYNGITPSV